MCSVNDSLGCHAMPRRTFRPYGYNQVLLLPSSLREWLPAHLDLTPIPTTYGGVTRGTVPSDPRRRVAVLLYAEARGVSASQQIARTLHEDIAFQPWRRIVRRISRPPVTSARSIWTRSGTYSCRRSCSVSGCLARCVRRGASACMRSGHQPASRFSGRSSLGTVPAVLVTGASHGSR